MSETYDLLLDRRAFLTASGALLVTLVAPGDWAEGQTTGSASRPAIAGDQLDSYITIDRDGTVVAYFGRIDGGQGVETAIAQMVAEEIEVPYERVRVVMGSTTVIDMGGASAGQGVSQSGMLLRRTAAEARRLLIGMASTALTFRPIGSSSPRASCTRLPIRPGASPTPSSSAVGFSTPR